MVRKLGGDDDAFMSYRTADYKLHFYETPANLRFVIITDTGTMSMRNVLHQIYINLWVEYGMRTHLLYAGRTLALEIERERLDVEAAREDTDANAMMQWSRTPLRLSNTKAAMV